MTPASGPIAGFEEWPDFVRATPVRQGHDDAGRLAAVLGVPAPPDRPPEVRRTGGWTVDGVDVTRLQWQLPYGPPTDAYLLTPEDHSGPLPAVLWNQCHAGVKWLGSERLVDLGQDTSDEVSQLQGTLYDGRAVANEVARSGFTVLTSDSFSWGSRRFPLDPPPARTGQWVDAQKALWAQQGVVPTPGMVYDAAASQHENTIAKVAGLLGTSYAGMVAYEDLIALEILRASPSVDPDRVGTAGFSGGGGRALVLAALSPDLRACVVSCMMTTFAGLLPDHVDHHSWLLNTPGLARSFEWPELTTLNPDCGFLVQYSDRDPLFPRAGMQDADAMLRELHPQEADRYVGTWYDEGHVFSSLLRDDAVYFLRERLSSGTGAG